MGDHHLVQQLIASYSHKKFMLKALLPLAAMGVLVIALVNFRKPDSTEKIKLSGTDLMIALDVSNSMMAKDIQPNRLEKAKLLISKIIDQLEGNRLGLVVFAGNAYLQMPLTTDASAAKLFLSTISPDLVPLQGTNIGEALLLCNRSLSTADKKYKSILLMSDGEDHDDAAISTAKELKDKGVVINTIGVGSPAGAPIMDVATAEYKQDDQGNVVVTKLNEKELQNIAAAANGSYQLLKEADVAANNIATQLQGMDKKPISDSTLTNYSSYYWLFLLLAMGLLIYELFISEKKKTSTPMKVAATSKPMHPPAKDILVKTTMFILLLICNFLNAFAQKDNELVRKGNDAYKQQKFEEAGKQYETALQQNSGNNTANFNLGNTKFKSGNYEAATKQYDALAGNKTDKQLLAKSLYNKGVSLIKQQKLDEAINAFKQSLRADPSDAETRENLQKALNEKKQQQQQKDKNDDKKEQKDDKKEDDKKDEKKNNPKDEKEKKDENKQNEKDQQQQQQPKPKISKENAEQKLQALRQEEKKLQERLNQKQKATTKQPEKDW